MSQGIYIAGAEPRNGKSVIVLGIMEMIAGRRGKIGFFRPVVQDETIPDTLTDLIIRRFGLDLPYGKMYGCTYRTASDLLVRDRDDDLLKLILDKYKTLEQECDLIVCAGSDFRSPAATLEFDFNARVANNLGCSVLPVVKGNGKNGGQIVGAAQGMLESLEERKCDIFGLVVNRVAEQLVDSVKSELQAVLPEDIPCYVFPELPLLGKPTVGEIAAALGAERVSGPEESFIREVHNFKVAAMELPHYLEHLEEGSLIIVPGDRSDIILGTLLADAAETYPHVAGIILTGGFRPASQVQR